MKLSEQTITETLQMNLKQKYAFYNSLKIDYPELEKNYPQIRFGIKHAFDIHEIFDKNLTQKPKRGIIRVRNTSIPLEEYRTEIENREALITHDILKHITTENPHYTEVNDDD